RKELMTPLNVSKPFLPLTSYEKAGQWLHRSASPWIRPIDYAVECSMHTFSTAINPGKFSNQPSFLAEATLRVMSVFISTLSLPLTLPLYVIGEMIDLTGDLLQKRPYNYLEGTCKEKQDTKNTYTVFSANLCMLPYGIATLGGVRSAGSRIDAAAEAILTADADFICLQEMSISPSLKLQEKIKDTYAHSFTRIGPMPTSRMGGGLFFASKYPIEEVQYHPLSNTGAIARGVFCAKTKAGWILNAHLSAGSSDEIVALRKKQMEEIILLSKKLSQEGAIPCFLFMDSNIQRTGKENDEYSLSQIAEHFTNGLNGEKPFTLTPENATCTNCLTSAIQGKEDPKNIEEGFEHIDCALSYKPSQVTVKSTVIPAYNLERREEALSDHHILLSEIKLNN
ncbi:MAG: endonuclease/exonuclease/phosphatase family protein, partial [Chlamydiota bacterium]